MSFAILALIIILVSFTVAKYSRTVSVAGAIIVIFAMTIFFLNYSLGRLEGADKFPLLGTFINMKVLIYISIVWLIADIISAWIIIRNYKYYLKVNSNNGK